ncbi:hypothetical protein Zmor_000958 [Zophobas morio]|uniref:Proteasome assembly chaperone 1 n=1 Tax=Zophobas morio TaxID=2755281 RepID=A0AA38J298_9CUCU|nr:hypothetical protein Zmor_000958 [Zophobas morio]
MVFGEIVEPSTRALIDDEFEEYPTYTKPQLIWEGNVGVPSNLNTLIFIEGNKLMKLFNALVLNSEMLYSSLNSENINIYNATNNTYIVSYVKKDLTTGEIIEELSQWLRKAKNIYAVVSEPISAYQNLNLSEKPETLIRKLSTDTADTFNCEKLESPNLVSGLGAGVVSYCIHSGLKSTLFVVYMDNSPLDSINTSPVVQLMKSLNLSVKAAASNLNPAASNLYL